MKKYIFFVIAALTLITTACSGGDEKIDVKKDAEDMAKEIVKIIKDTNVENQKAFDSLVVKVDSIQEMTFKFYGENKKDENGNSLLDSLKYYYNESGKQKVDSALCSKRPKVTPKDTNICQDNKETTKTN